VLRLVAAGAVLVAVMVTIKDQRVLERTHVVGSCATVQEDADGSEWRKCVGGRLTGPPGLELAGCSDWGWYASGEFWRCPAALAPSAVRE
jgi:hypothetical protein